VGSSSSSSQASQQCAAQTCEAQEPLAALPPPPPLIAMSIEEFHNLLGTLRSIDNTARQAAEATYNSTKESQPVTVLMFLAQTIQCPDEGLRAFAAVLFRRSCPELWRSPAVDAGTKTTIKQLLIETIRQVCCRRSPCRTRDCFRPLAQAASSVPASAPFVLQTSPC
jgi:hypothetical protein